MVARALATFLLGYNIETPLSVIAQLTAENSTKPPVRMLFT